MRQLSELKRSLGGASHWIEQAIREWRKLPVEQPDGYLRRAQRIARTFPSVPAQLQARKASIAQINEEWARMKEDARRQLIPELEGLAQAVDSLKADLQYAVPAQQKNGTLSVTDYNNIQAGVQAYKLHYRKTLGSFRAIENRSAQLCKSLRKADNALQELLEKTKESHESLQRIWRTVSILRRKNFGMQDCAAPEHPLFPEDLYEEIRQVNARAQGIYSQLEPLMTDCQNAIREAEISHFEFMTVGDSLVSDFNDTTQQVARYDGQEFSCQDLKRSMRITANSRNHR